jgi:hypothetical protein
MQAVSLDTWLDGQMGDTTEPVIDDRLVSGQDELGKALVRG